PARRGRGRRRRHRDHGIRSRPRTGNPRIAHPERVARGRLFRRDGRRRPRGGRGMSAVTGTRPAVLEGERIPFLRHVRIELRKTVDTRASAWLLIAIAAITVGATVLPLFLSSDGSGLDWASFVLFASSGWSFLLPFIGVLSATSEWTQRTALSTFTLEPRRTVVNLAKLVASLILGIAMVAATYAAGAVVNVIGIAFFDGSGSWALDGVVVLGYLGTMAI